MTRLQKRAAYLKRQERVRRLAEAANAKLSNDVPTFYLGGHRDERGRRFYSINYFDGEAGWQSRPYYKFNEALAYLQHVKGEYLNDGREVRP